MSKGKVDYLIDLTAIEDKKDVQDHRQVAADAAKRIMAMQPSAWGAKAPWNEIAKAAPKLNISSIGQTIASGSNAYLANYAAKAANLPSIQASLMGLATSTKIVDNALSAVLPMGPVINRLIEQMNMVARLPGLVNGNIVQALLASTSGLQNIFGQWLPNNLKPVYLDSDMSATEFVQEIVAVGLAEGIPFFCIVDSKLAGRLFRAKSEQARRKILSTSLSTVLKDCSRFLDIDPNTKAEQKYLSLLQESIEVIKNGHLAAGTTLLAEIGETLSSRIHDPRLQKATRNQIVLEQEKRESKAEFHQRLNREEQQAEREEIRSQDTRTSLALSPVYSSFVHYHLNEGDSMPLRFSRHAVSHNIDRVRFSKVNAAQGLLTVCGLACYLFNWD